MQRAKRHRPFIADLASQGVGPREPYMMRLARHPPADEAGPRGHRARMLFVPNALGGGKGEDGFVNVAFLSSPCRLVFFGPLIRCHAMWILNLKFLYLFSLGGVFNPPLVEGSEDIRVMLALVGLEIRQRATQFLDPIIVPGPEGFEILMGLDVLQPPPERRAKFDRVLIVRRICAPRFRSYLRRERIPCVKTTGYLEHGERKLGKPEKSGNRLDSDVMMPTSCRQIRMPKELEHWSLTTLREKLVKIGAKVVRHGSYVTFQLAEVAVPRNLFREILHLIDGPRRRPAPA